VVTRGHRGERTRALVRAARPNSPPHEIEQEYWGLNLACARVARVNPPVSDAAVVVTRGHRGERTRALVRTARPNSPLHEIEQEY